MAKVDGAKNRLSLGLTYERVAMGLGVGVAAAVALRYLSMASGKAAPTTTEFVATGPTQYYTYPVYTRYGFYYARGSYTPGFHDPRLLDLLEYQKYFTIGALGGTIVGGGAGTVAGLMCSCLFRRTDEEGVATWERWRIPLAAAVVAMLITVVVGTASSYWFDFSKLDAAALAELPAYPHSWYTGMMEGVFGSFCVAVPAGIWAGTSIKKRARRMEQLA